MGADPQWDLLSAGNPVYHVHPAAYGALAFNPHVDPRALSRFAPVFAPDGSAIPSWYGGLTFQGALFETVFRGVVGQVDRTIYRTLLKGQVLSTVALTSNLRLLRLHGTGPVTLGLHTEITTLLPNRYGESRQTGQELHDKFPEAQGLIWRSRISNDEFSFVLYADRVMPAVLGRVLRSVPLDSDDGLAFVMAAANPLGTVIV